jgi:DNA-directed RNA polymerase sigma subunit (sigma70/sigma32)
VSDAKLGRRPSFIGSPDERVAGDGDRQYADVLAAPNAPNPLRTLCDGVPDLEEKPSRLPARSPRVIELRYGLDDGAVRTADSVADELGVAGERVRQIELRTLRKPAAESSAVARAA